jgi:hypothetical protein
MRRGRRVAGRRAVAAALVAAILAGPTRAAPPADPEAAVVEELVVVSHAGGPAWWRVSSPTSVVYVLGTPQALPRGLKWDQTLARRRLAGAREMIAPPVVRAGLGDVFPLLAARRRFRSKGPMEASLPPDLRARFLADKRALNPDPKAYSGWTPLVAGLLMVQDFRRQAALDPREPAGTMTRLARDAGVRIAPAASYRAVPLVRAAQTGLSQAGPACLADALDEVEAGAGRSRAAAAGWMRGDVAAALQAQRGYEKCLASLPEGADLANMAIADTAAAIARALATPGHSVAVVNLRTLLARGGVLQQLETQGFAVSRPDG